MLVRGLGLVVRYLGCLIGGISSGGVSLGSVAGRVSQVILGLGNLIGWKILVYFEAHFDCIVRIKFLSVLGYRGVSG